jgi:hypothetical protein
VVGLYYKFANRVDPQLETAWFQPLSVSSEKTRFQSFAFKFNSYRYAVFLAFAPCGTRLVMMNVMRHGGGLLRGVQVEESSFGICDSQRL